MGEARAARQLIYYQYIQRRKEPMRTTSYLLLLLWVWSSLFYGLIAPTNLDCWRRTYWRTLWEWNKDIYLRDWLLLISQASSFVLQQSPIEQTPSAHSEVCHRAAHASIPQPENKNKTRPLNVSCSRRIITYLNWRLNEVSPLHLQLLALFGPSFPTFSDRRLSAPPHHI